MEKIDLYHKISAVLLMIAGIMHLLSPLVYVQITMEVISFLLFGGIYLALGILLFLKEDMKVLGILSILLTLIGAIGGTVILIGNFSTYLLVMLILDPFIIILRILVYKEKF